MNEIVNKFLLARDKLMPEMYLKQPRFSYSGCEPFTKNKERNQNLKKQEIQYIFIKSNQIKLCFQYDMAYGDFKDLPRRTATDKVLCDKAFNIAK